MSFGKDPTTDVVRHRLVMLARDLDRLDETIGERTQDLLTELREVADARDAAFVRALAAESRVRVLEAALGLKPGEGP